MGCDSDNSASYEANKNEYAAFKKAALARFKTWLDGKRETRITFEEVLVEPRYGDARRTLKVTETKTEDDLTIPRGYFGG